MKHLFDINLNQNSIEKELKVLSSIGILADIQYADCDDGHCHHKKNVRYYRNSLNLIKNAIQNFKNHETKTKASFKCLVQLGDLIDGKCKQNNSSQTAVQKCLDELNKISEKTKLLHIWGNHEFYNFLRKDLVNTQLNTARFLGEKHANNANYYSFDITDKVKLICLDFYELSILGYEKEEANYLKAMKFYTDFKNSNDRKFVTIRDGALSDEQFDWLENELEICKKANINVIVCGHCPIYEADRKDYLAINSNKILDLLWKYDQFVIMYLAGHYHPGGFSVDSHNIYHLTLAGLVETAPDSNSYLVVDVFDDKISVYSSFNF